MQKIKRIVVLIFLIAICVFVVSFTLDNRQLAQIHYMSFSTPELPLALLVILFFVLGMLVAPLLGIWQVLKLKHRCRSQSKTIRQLERKLEELHAEQKQQQLEVIPADPQA